VSVSALNGRAADRMIPEQPDAWRDGLHVDSQGTMRWYLDGKLHREDGPAVKRIDGLNWWCIKGRYHRVDGPAVEYMDGTALWYRHDSLHRTDGPAVQMDQNIGMSMTRGLMRKKSWIGIN
jgi:hypothetical protein